MIGIAICRTLQGVVTIGWMVVIPVGWFFFGWKGPIEAFLGGGFIGRVADGVLWTVGSMLAMFMTFALEKVVHRLSSHAPEPKPAASKPAPPPAAPPSFYGDPADTFGDTTDGEHSEKVAYYQSIEAYIAKMGWYEKVLLRQGTDKEFGIATLKIYEAGFEMGWPANVVGAFVMEAVNRYEPDRRLALAFAEALENQIYAKRYSEEKQA